MTDPLPTPKAPLTLRPFVVEDAPRIYALSQERGLREWIPDQVYASEAQAREVLRFLIAQYAVVEGPSAAPWVLGVCLAGIPEVIGHVGLSPLGGDVEIGYAIEERHQGRGYASEAVRAMATWAVGRFGLSRVLGVVSRENRPSCRVLERAGFSLVAQERRALHGRAGLVRTYGFPAGGGAEAGRASTKR